MFGVFLILAGIGLLGALLTLFEAVEQASIRRLERRRAVIARERLERGMSELWPARLQRDVYDQDEEVA